MPASPHSSPLARRTSRLGLSLALGLLALTACQKSSAPDEAASAASAAASGPDGAASAWLAEPRDPTPTLATQAASTTIPPIVLQELEKAKVSPDHVALLVVPVDGGPPLVNHRTAEPMNPASVMKLVTTAAALDLLGTSYRWHTRLWTDGTVRDGTLNGNVYLQGRGDPKLVVERLWLLMRELQHAGIRRIGGDIVLDHSAFDVPPVDPASFDGDPLRPYNARPDALLVNFKTFTLKITPDEAQKQAYVGLEPPLEGVTLPAALPLAEGKCAPWLNKLAALSLKDRNLIVPAEPYPVSCGIQQLTLAHPAPEQFAARAVAGMWKALGGELAGSIREGTVPEAVRGRRPLADSASPTASEIVHDINKFSNNVMAQQVFLTLGMEHSGVGTLESGKQAVTQWWQHRLGDTPMPDVQNGSGLSREGRVSASSLGAMLQRVWRTPGMPEFVASLPIAGVDGTLRRTHTAFKGNAHLKTGTLKDASALAGYVLSETGRRYVMVAMANGSNAQSARPAFQALMEWVITQPVASSGSHS